MSLSMVIGSLHSRVPLVRSSSGKRKALARAENCRTILSMHGLLQRRKAWSAPLAESRPSFWLPEPSAPEYPAACERWDREAEALAVAHGLPAVGARMVGAHGIEWEVAGHAFAPSVATLGKGVEWATDPRLLFPVVFPTNLGSERLGRMMAQLSLCTPKELVTLDTVPEARPGLHAPHSHWVDAASDPRRILLFLDAAIAHELGHVWLDAVEGIEDHRVLEDLTETVRYNQVQMLQSFVLDFAVNDLVRRKGFDLTPILDDRRVTLGQMAVAVAKGYRPPSPWEAVQMATLVAEALVEEDAHPVRADDALAQVKQGLTEEWALAQSLATAVRECPPTSAGSAIRAIDRVLTLCFAHAGEHLDLGCDLIHLPPSVEWRDKWPGWLEGLTPPQKAELGRAIARLDVAPEAEVDLRPGVGATWACFGSDAAGWTEPVALPFRLPGAPPAYEETRRIMETNEASRRRQEERMGTMAAVAPKLPGSPVPQGPRIPGPPAPPMPKIPWPPTPFVPPAPGRRAYSTGLGRWITQVRMEQMLAGESAYGYANGNPMTYTDPSGRYPQLSTARCQGIAPLHHLPFIPWNGSLGPSFSYGSYCGSDNVRNPAWGVLPQDATDECCRVHDRCLEAHYGAGFIESTSHRCCDDVLIRCTTRVAESCTGVTFNDPSCECSRSPRPAACAGAAQLVAQGITISRDTYYKGSDLSIGGQCLPQKDWKPFYEKCWGSRYSSQPCSPAPVQHPKR